MPFDNPTHTPAGPTLHRLAATMDRAMEYFTEKELALQIGCAPQGWPRALLKEMVDNGLDAAEAAGRAPIIDVTTGPGTLRVADNGIGIAAAIVRSSLDYSTRTSDKAAYVSPTRGQLGNALKALWAAPFVLDGTAGRVDVEAHGTRHRVDVTLDAIRQRPALAITETSSTVKTGTAVTLHLACLDGAESDAEFYRVLSDIGRFNPHARISLNSEIVSPPTAPDWRGWRPTDPTDPGWYRLDQFAALVRAYIGGGRAALPVRDFLAEFAGMSGTQARARILADLGLKGAGLADLVRGGDVDMDIAARLFHAMIRTARRVKPDRLGIIGADHLTAGLGQGTEYKRVLGTADGLPYAIEAASGVRWDGEPGGVVVGLNRTALVHGTPRDVSRLLAEALVDFNDPVHVAVHISIPRPGFLDRSKSTIGLPPALNGPLAKAIGAVTRAWTAAMKHQARASRAGQRTIERIIRDERADRVTVKDAAEQVMERAYLAASAGGTLPANARQVMYAARPLIIELTGNATPWASDSYFTQTLLPDYLEDHPEAAGWDIVYDDRGHFAEPHGGTLIGLGTLAVREYLADWPAAPKVDGQDWSALPPALNLPARLRFGGALFVEKEGFTAVLERSGILERFDLALMSTKGMSVTAARSLVDRVSQAGIPIFLIRDLDKFGLTISRTIQSDTRRYRYAKPPLVIDLGLHLADAQAMGLESEPVEYSGKKDPRIEIAHCGADADTTAFLCDDRPGPGGQWRGRRVELNAMRADQFVTWLERSLIAAGAAKVEPDPEALVLAYQRAALTAKVERELSRIVARLAPPDPPPDLGALVAARRATHPAESWSTAVAQIVEVSHV